MIRFTDRESNNYSLNFQHRREVDTTPVNAPDTTYCDIIFHNPSVPDTKWILGTGIAMCHPNDQFEKEKGRKIALTKALDAAKFPRHLRTLAWEAYHARKRS
jgi:hypothetical protein